MSYLAIFISTEDDVFVANEPIDKDDPQEAVNAYHKRTGNWPERAIIVGNGEHPDPGCYDLVPPEVLHDVRVDCEGEIY